MSTYHDELPYDKDDRESIIRYARTFVGSTLRKSVGVGEIADPKTRRGSFGNAVERFVFRYDPNNDAAPDFKEVGMELKTTPLRRLKNGDIVSKERLVISMIDYLTVVDETWETSTFLKKAADILLFSYLFEKEKNPVDYEIVIADRLRIPQEDIPVIKNDWETVVGKVRDGRAHEISGSDTLYLEACTKAADSSVRRGQPFSNIPAKPRAWAFKASYMMGLSRGLLKARPIHRSEAERTLPLIDLIRKRFEPHKGKTERELAEELGVVVPGGSIPKQMCALIAKRVLGVEDDSDIAEFEKAGIKAKSMRIKRNGVPKEDVSFPAFDYCEVAARPFEESAFFGQLEQKHLFVIFREDAEARGVYRYDDVMLWQMPEADLEEARACYEEMSRRIRDGRADESVKKSENRCCHVRPHARNKEDTQMTPYGRPVVKKCFWLNAGYIAEELKRVRE